MAAGIVDCTGKQIMIGDKLKTATGDVIEVCGAMVSEHVLFNAETCTVVDKDTPLTNTGHVTEFKKVHGHDGPLGGGKTTTTSTKGKASKEPKAATGDCVVWGT